MPLKSQYRSGVPSASTGTGLTLRLAPCTLPPVMVKEVSLPSPLTELAFPLMMKSLTLPMPSPIVASTVPPEIVTAPAGSALLPETPPT